MKTGILITNTGTPDAATTPAVRRYLREFLSDKRVVHIPRFIWLPILYGLILPFRSPKSAKLYQEIWTPQGSPMRIHMNDLRVALENNSDYLVEVGMNYGNPSIASGLQKLKEREVEHIIVLPLFPQYSHTTTGSTIDRIKQNVITIHDYYKHPSYIAALAESVKTHWQQHGKAQHLLISFHGIPERFAAEGDPYPEQCTETARLLAEALQIPKDQWTQCYQSQFGYDKWLKPSTQDLFAALPQQGVKSIDIICPGFAVDCLETLEEIAKRGKKSFIAAGGETFNYIPALNNQPAHVKALLDAIFTS